MEAEMAAAKKKKASNPSVSLVVTDDSDVKLKIKPGVQLQVVEVGFITPDLESAPRIGARLCGYGSNVCLALIETGK
jgi:hypothetical protein